MSIKELTKKVKELTTLARELSKLLIEIVSFVGWILILIKLFQ